MLRHCHECSGDFNSEQMIRRVPPATRIAGLPPVTRVTCLSCAEAQDQAVLREAQRLINQLQAA